MRDGGYLDPETMFPGNTATLRGKVADADQRLLTETVGEMVRTAEILLEVAMGLGIQKTSQAGLGVGVVIL